VAAALTGCGLADARHRLSVLDAGRLAPDTRLPSETELAAQYGVARVSVRRAIEQLRERGKVITFQGKGTYVTPNPEST
jgi:GntR family transcriptional regulator